MLHTPLSTLQTATSLLQAMSLAAYTFATLSCFTLVTSADNNNVIVALKDGQVSGQILRSTKGNEYSAFTGIPYAKPPIGDLRFEPPERVTPWEGILNSTQHLTVKCPQVKAGVLVGQEDCLYINVYSPKSNHTDLAVIAFIHGGSFETGSGNFRDFGPQRFMDKDIVLVTFNYRLGPLGYFAYPEQGIPGNSALLDKIAALKWVRDNVASFGGNASKVTICGQSSGAAATVYLILSPEAKGLFHGAIIQSGSAVCVWAQSCESNPTVRALTSKLNCPTYPLETMMDCLKTKSWQDIIDEYDDFKIIADMPIKLAPRVDGKVVPGSPPALLRQGSFNHVPVMIGTNKDEGALLYSKIRHIYPRLGRDFLQIDFPEIMSFLHGSPVTLDKLLDPIISSYFTGVDFNNSTQFIQGVINFYSDITYSCVTSTTQYLANSTQEPLYSYKFAYRGKYSFAENQPREDLGVGHMDELQYLFDSIPLTGNDLKMSEIMLTLWTNFAKTHNPTPSDGGDPMPFVWPRYKSGKEKCLHLNLNPTQHEYCGVKLGQIGPNEDCD